MLQRLLSKAALAGFLLLAWNSHAATDAPRCAASSGPMRTSLLELFTSEGCSSCPPADRWLSGLRTGAGGERQWVSLAFHVDYWNGLGWEDRFSKPVYSVRQRWLADLNRSRTVYTPQFVLNGRDWRPSLGMPETQSNPPAGASLSLELGRPAAGRLEVRGEARLLSPMPGAQVFLALYENNLTSRIGAGENTGSLLRHDFVVRELVGPLSLPASGVLSIQHGFRLGADWKHSDLGVSAFVQNAATGAVVQALQRPACKS